MTRLLYVLLFATALASSQVTASNFVGDVETAFRNGFDEAVAEIQLLITKLKHFFESLVESKKTQITQIVDLASQTLDQDDSLDQACKDEIKKALEMQKGSSLSNFFTCSNLTDAMVETGSIIVFSLELTANLTENFNAIFSRLNECSSESIIKRPYCWFQAVLNVKDDIEKDTSDIAFFKNKVTKLAEDIRSNIEYCSNPPIKNLSAVVRHAIAASKDCQKKPVQH